MDNQFKLIKSPIQFGYAQPQQLPTQAPQKKNKGILSSLISEVGGTGGALGGAAIGTALLPGLGTLVGAGLGGFLGGTGGRVVENKVRDDRIGFGDALKEGAVSGVMSAGPLRLLKGGATAAKAATVGGQSLTQAIKTGGKAGAELSLLKKAGEKATAASEGAIVKGLGLTKVQKNSVLKDTGETAGKLAKRFGIFNAEDVAPAKEALFKEFDDVTSKIGAIPTVDVQATLQKKIQALAKQAPSDKKKMAKSLAAEAKAVLSGFGDTVDAKELNTIKGQFDSLVNYTQKQADPNKYGINKRMADGLREVLQKNADALGLVSESGKSLKDIGLDLRKIGKLETQVAKNVEGAGGTSVFGIRNMLGGALGGGAVGGPMGIAGGFLAPAVLNNQTVRTAGAKSLDATARKLSQSNGATLAKVAAGTLVGGGGIRLGVDQLSNNAPIMSNIDTNTNPNISSPSIVPQLSSSNPNMSSTFSDQRSGEQMDSSPFSPSNLNTTIEQVLASGGGLKEIGQILAVAKDYQALTQSATKAKAPNSEQIKLSNNATSGLQDVQYLRNQLQNNPNIAKLNSLPGGQTIKGLLGTSGYEAARQNVADVIGRLRSGGAINRDEETRFLNQLPSAFEPVDKQIEKLNRIEQLLSSFIVDTSQGGGVTINDIMSAYAQ